MSKKKLKVAVTGSIGSGKSTFCKFISEKGYPVFKADELSKNILANDQDVKKKVLKEFGNQSFVNNEINKKFLAEEIFSNSVKVLKINSILHPKVKKEIESLNNKYLREHDIIFTEAALIYEADMESLFDYIVLITADYEIRKARAINAGELSEEDFNKRNENQIKDEEKKKRADFVFHNNEGIEELKTKAEFLLVILKGLRNN